LDPGLPWEEKDIEGFGSYLAAILGNRPQVEVRRRLRQAYDEGMSYRSLLPAALSEPSAAMVRARVTAWGPDDLALRLMGNSLVLANYRSWRRIFVRLAAASIAVVALGSGLAVALAWIHG
jgi:hypothetical protein